MVSLADESIISDFVAESREHLNTIEPDLLAMEEQGSGAPQEVINRVFRAIHSIKGGAGFFAFEHLKHLSHAMESVLMQVRDGKLLIQAEVMDTLFTALDRLRAMLDDIHASDQVPVEAELAALKAILENKGISPDALVKGKSKDSRQPAFNLGAEEVRSAIGRGMRIYHAVAYLHQDIGKQDLTPLAFLNNALSVGQMLDAFIDIGAIVDLEGCLEADLPVGLLFASVLEPELAALALRLPESQIFPLDMAHIKKQLKEKGKGEPIRDLPLAAPKAPSAPAAPVMEVPAAVETRDTPEAQDEAPEAAPAEASASRATREAGNETLRVRVDLLTGLMNLAGELVLGRNQLFRALSDSHSRHIPGLTGILQNMNQVTTQLQEGIMQTRMQPIGTIFSRFPRIVRDMSRNLNKQIDVEMKGAEVELDKSIVEMLADPLTHIIRNCADHAIEMPETRRKAGKSPTGRILLHAYHEGGQVCIAITDDGQGIDPRKVLKKAIDRKLVDPDRAAEMTDREIVNLVFAPGFSTAETVSEISGRGVGMDVVRTNTEKLGGHVELDTRVGEGTTVLLRLPLTLAIIPSMILGVETQRFAIPQVNVVEFVWVRAADVAKRIERVHGAQVLRLRDLLLPLVRLADVLGLERTFLDPATATRKADRRTEVADRRSGEKAEVLGPDGEPIERIQDRRQDWRSDYNIVVLRVGSNQFGVIVDELFDIEEIVVKPLSGFLKGCRCFSGATILGDGGVIMILDAGGVAAQAQLHFSDLQADEKRRLEEEHRKAALAASRRRSVILFSAADGERFAVPQDHVLRLERIPVAAIERLGDKEYVEYRGEGLPLIRLDRLMEVKPIPDHLQEVFVIIPKIMQNGLPAKAPAGLLIATIIDALDVDVELKAVDVKGSGILGSAMVQDHLTLFLDPVELVRAAGVVITNASEGSHR
jgi:two-component system chemotaxis sensor kinase CheA